MPTQFFGFKGTPSLPDLKTKFTDLLLSKNITDAPAITAKLIKVDDAGIVKMLSPFPLFNCAPAATTHIKALHKHLKPYGHSLISCWSLFAELYNFKGWQEFKSAIKNEYQPASEDPPQRYWLRYNSDETGPYQIGHENHTLEFSTKGQFKQFCEAIAIPHDTGWALINKDTGETEIVSRSLSRVIAVGESMPGSPYWMRAEYRKLAKGCHTFPMPFTDGGMGSIYTIRCRMSEIDRSNPKIYPGVVCEIFRNSEKKPLASFLVDDYITATGSIQKSKFLKKYGYYETLYASFSKGMEQLVAREKTDQKDTAPKVAKKTKRKNEHSESIIELPPVLWTVRKAATRADGGLSWYRKGSRTPASLRSKPSNSLPRVAAT